MKSLKIIAIIVCVTGVAVHIAGLSGFLKEESLLSHIIHLISYSLCLYAVLKLQSNDAGKFVYAFGAIYPFLFHARCFFLQLSGTATIGIAICLSVAIVMPLGLLLFRKN